MLQLLKEKMIVKFSALFLTKVFIPPASARGCLTDPSSTKSCTKLVRQQHMQRQRDTRFIEPKRNQRTSEKNKEWVRDEMQGT